jgi:hypothetical protein
MPNFKAKLGDGFVELPFDVKKEFGKARVPVRISLNGYSYRSTVCVYGGKYFVPVRRSHREGAGIKEGGSIFVKVSRDDEARVIEPPHELAAALAKSRAAKVAWEKLSYTDKKERAQSILLAKKPETRARRLEKIMEGLTAAK